MSKAIVLDKKFAQSGEIALPERYAQIKEHNLYLYVKSYLASMRANNAYAKKRGEVSGGGKKPWNQKGGGRARAGSITSPVFVGGGVHTDQVMTKTINSRLTRNKNVWHLNVRCIKKRKKVRFLWWILSRCQVAKQKMLMLCLKQ